MEAIRHAATITMLSMIIYARCQTSGPAGSCWSVDGQRSYECVSKQCLKCAMGVENTTKEVDERISVELGRHPANCTYDPTNSTLTCVPDTSTCTVETCSQSCQFCLGQYHKREGVALNGDGWEFTSHCANLETHMDKPDCESNKVFYPDRCFNRLEFDTSQRDDVMSGRMEIFGLSCHCYELNCTAEMAEFEFEFRPNPPSPNETTPTSHGGDTATLPSFLIAIIIIAVPVGGFFVFCLLSIIAFCMWRKLKNSRSIHMRAPVRHDDQLNDQPYQLMNLIGQGRYGYVYKAQYRDNIVAVKIFSHHSRTSWETECALNSMESTAHENIVEFVAKESRGAGISLQLVIITRYYPLGSLNQFLRKHVVSLQQASVMISSVANGLAHLHAEYYTNSSGIVTEKYAIAHRDMKTANILVKSENGDCVIGDLGFAMILDPSLDSKQLASTGQVGTFRYMAPEVLDTRVHLQDLQSFKQIDVYAFSLIMWEVMSRCCILSAEDVPCYQLPFEEVAGTRPSLDTMKDMVVARKLRPSLPPMWANDECLKELFETLVECWDKDPEARLSAANVVYRMEEFTKELNQDNHSSGSGVSTQYNTMTTSFNTMVMVPFGQPPMECSQSSPPPYYSPTDPNSFQNASDFPGPIPSPLRHFFPDSMPRPPPTYTSPTSGGVSAGYYWCDRPTRTLRNSACSEGGAIRMNVYDSHEPLSVRNSLILGGERRIETETNFGVLAEGRASLLYEHSNIDEMQGENDEYEHGNIDDSTPSSWHLIGKGHYGYVYKAQYQGDIVAVNIYSRNYQTVWETECTLNSMESMAHENVVEFVAKESRGSGISLQLVIITRYYPLGSLNQFLRKHVVSLQQASVMISSVANGLAHLHAEYYTNSSGIVTEKYAIAHRDMKSTNVYIKEKTGKCIIGDLRVAMILEPSLDINQLTITKQVGTFRYMAPEVLDTRVHLIDLQSFKQIDVYAFSLIMWEVMSRCWICNVISAEDVPCYQLPFEEVAGIRPSLDTMKDIVVTGKLRPALPPMWANDEHLKQIHGVLMKCWDDDPRTRLSAAEVVHQMQEFSKGGYKSAVMNVCSANGSDLDMKDFNLNSDSGVQNLHSNSMTSASMDLSSNNPNSSSSGSSDSVVSNLSDELFSKHQLPKSSIDTLDLDH